LISMIVGFLKPNVTSSIQIKPDIFWVKWKNLQNCITHLHISNHYHLMKKNWSVKKELK
jgi:hypothetical protein